MKTQGVKQTGWSTRTVVALAVSLAAGVGVEKAAAQGRIDPGPVVVLRTGGGTALTTHVQTLSVDTTVENPKLQFAFGFATGEGQSPGAFLDSVTLTLKDAGSALGAIFVTVDSTGAYWAPSAPGGLSISPDSVGRQPIGFPDIPQAPEQQFSYFVTASIPAELTGKPLNFYLDLFDNQNALPSLAWVNTAVVVPEPSMWALAIACGLCWVGFKRRS